MIFDRHKICLFLIAASFIFICSVNFKAQSQSKHIEAIITDNIFNNPENKPYIELYFSIIGSTLRYEQIDSNKYSGGVNIIVYFMQGEKVFKYDKYNLVTNIIRDTLVVDFDLNDQRRYSLPNGNYKLEIEIEDLKRKGSKLTFSKDLAINFKTDTTQISNIALVSGYEKTEHPNIFSKNGYTLNPYPGNYYPTLVNKIIFYAEIYNQANIIKEDYLIISSIKHASTQVIVKELTSFSKQKAEKVNIIFSQFDISQIPSGNYVIEIVVKNKKNELIATKQHFFQRNNKAITNDVDFETLDILTSFVRDFDLETIRYLVQTLFPIANSSERTQINKYRKSDDIIVLKRYFLAFWLARNSYDPETEWANYNKKVDEVNSVYNTVAYKGFLTDRGRVYLQYGPPNRIVKSDWDPGTRPYEIWHYYALDETQTDVRFVFNNEDMISNDYRLVYSNAFGEVSNSAWKQKLEGINMNSESQMGGQFNTLFRE